jgi:type IV fimbrial biogenesis protein FimT
LHDADRDGDQWVGRQFADELLEQLMRAHIQSGVTLIELLVVTAILGLIVAIALPSFSDMMARRRVEGLAASLAADLQYARTQAATDNDNVTLATTTTSTTSTYTISGTGSRSYKSVTLDSGLSVTDGVSIVFTPMRGCVTDNTCSAADTSISVSSSYTSQTFTVTVNRMGRVAVCAVGGAIGGYQSC